MVSNEVLNAIYKRRSIRNFTETTVSEEMLIEIISAGAWAPSGLNNQPWRFAVVTESILKAKFEPLTRYSMVIKSAMALLPVFVDRNAMYNEVKDHQAVGACIQNMLLAAQSIGLGAVWLGEIIKSSKEVGTLLGLDESMELMAVVAVGYPADSGKTPSRKDIEELIVYRG